MSEINNSPSKQSSDREPKRVTKEKSKKKESKQKAIAPNVERTTEVYAQMTEEEKKEYCEIRNAINNF